MKRLFIWRDVWFYNKKGMFVGVGENADEALNNVVKYLTSINFGNMSYETIESMVREMAIDRQPEIVNTPIGMILWQPE